MSDRRCVDPVNEGPGCNPEGSGCNPEAPLASFGARILFPLDGANVGTGVAPLAAINSPCRRMGHVRTTPGGLSASATSVSTCATLPGIVEWRCRPSQKQPYFGLSRKQQELTATRHVNGTAGLHRAKRSVLLALRTILAPYCMARLKLAAGLGQSRARGGGWGLNLENGSLANK